jgi:hypothetical protein
VITRKIAKSDIPTMGMRTRASRESTSRTIAHLSDKFEAPAISPKASNAVLEFADAVNTIDPEASPGAAGAMTLISSVRLVPGRKREDRPPFRGQALRRDRICAG